MNTQEVLLSSPCGYFGEVALWPIRNLRFAAASAGDPDSKAATPRSHFRGMRIIKDGPSWRCEGLVNLSPVLRAFPVPFAELADSQDVVADAPDRVSFFSPDSTDYSKFDEVEPSQEFIQATESYTRIENDLHQRSARLARALATQVLPKVVADLSFALHEDVELPKDRSYQLMNDWVDKNRQILLTLHYGHVDDLLSDVARKLSVKFRESMSSGEEREKQGLDDRIEHFLLGASNFIVFLSRIIKLHWFLGHDGWSDLIGKLDSGFPRTPPPSFAWIWNHRSDAPWWRALLQPGFKDLVNANKEFQELELMSLARSFLWPKVYQVAIRRSSQHDSIVVNWIHPPESFSLAEKFRYYLARFTDWWTFRLSEDVLTPVIVSGEDLDALDAEEDNLTSHLFHLENSGDAARTAIEKRLSIYRKETVQSPAWKSKYHEAFPSVGENLTISELLNKDRLGFALKELETEVEGDRAWVRLVHNSVFEDAYGPKALFVNLKKELRKLQFKHLGQSAIVHSFIEKSNHCQMLLREFVQRILSSEYGDAWLERGVPSKVREKVEKRQGGQRFKDTCGAREMIGEFFRETDILDYILVLEYENNWSKVAPLLRHVGIEPSSKGSIKCFWEWKDKRNEAAHPEKSSQVTSEDLESLDHINHYVSFLLLLTTGHHSTRS